MWGRLSCLPCTNFQPIYLVGAQGGGKFSGVAMVGGDSFCMDDWLGMEDPLGKRCFPNTFQSPCLGGKSSVVSLQLLEDKQHLGGEDCNIPKNCMQKIGILNFSDLP